MPRRRLLPLVLLSLVGSASATTPAGTHFSHHDWELACDNTRTCRAAGYHADGSDMPVSVLLTREAGAGTPVTAQLMLGDYGDDDAPTNDKEPLLTMWVDGRRHGTVALESMIGTLSPAQVEALLATLTGDGPVAWIGEDGRRWELSTRGSTAVLLKMDDVQGRVGSPGALVRKGTRSEANVPGPLPKPSLQAAPTWPASAADTAVVNASEGLSDALVAALGDYGDCSDLQSPDAAPGSYEVVRLSDTKLLVSRRCWLAAYNAGNGYWVIDDAPPWNPVLVTTMGNDYEDGTISASHKGRGLGDCWSSDAWTWDGRAFVHTRSATTGQCKLMQPGGARDLPTLDIDVRPAATTGKVR